MAESGTMTEGEEAEFRRCYEANFAAVYRYVSARERDRSEVGDIVADIFAVAWRRRADRPTGADERLWLLGVARRTLADHRRSAGRRKRLVTRISLQPALAPRTTDPDLTARLEEAMALLGERDREALRLLAWDDLSRADAAQLLGCSVTALNVRVHRALRRLSNELGGADDRRRRPSPAADTTTDSRGDVQP